MEGLKPCVRSTFESDIYMSTVKSDLHITMTNILKVMEDSLLSPSHFHIHHCSG